jgi:hypothetical protein
MTSLGRAAQLSHTVLLGKKPEEMEAVFVTPYETLGVADIKAAAATLLASAFVALEVRADPGAPPEGTFTVTPLTALPGAK